MTLSTQNGYHAQTAIDNVLNIRRPSTDIDDYAAKALVTTEKNLFVDGIDDPSKGTYEGTWAHYRKQNSISNSGGQSNEILKQTTEIGNHLLQKIGLDKIDAVTKRLDAAVLDDITRLLLSRTGIYAFMLLQSVGSIKEDDVAGLANGVLLRISGTPRNFFLANIVGEVAEDLRIDINPGDNTDKVWPALMRLVKISGVDIRAGQTRDSFIELLERVYREGNIPHYLEEYIKQKTADNIISQNLFTPKIRQSMIDHLINLGIDFNTDKAEANFVAGKYDQYFLLAYNEALKKSSVADDPIDGARIKGGEITWDFTVDFLESTRYQGVIPTNIKAAGALDYIYTIGEEMRVFDVANALVLRWASGMLDVPEGKTAGMLYRFHKLRNERNTVEERAMLYKRVLNKGDGKLLSSMVANTAFPRLWHQFMEEVVAYIRKAERSRDVWVSKSPIFEATKNLQYNLTEHMTGMSHVQVAEDYAHLQEALDILRADEIINSFGGRRKSLWSVIEQVAKEDLNAMVQTATLKTIAVEGNKVFQWVASFESDRTASETNFAVMLSAAESWIIAQASLEPNGGSQVPQQPEQPQMPDFLNNLNNMNNMNMPNFDQEVEEFADW